MSKHHVQLADWYRNVKNDIFKLAAACNFEPTRQQAELLQAVQDGRQAITVRSGQGPGKSTSTGVVALWRLLQANKAKIILTAPTMKQCKDVWLAELRKTRERADPLIQNLFEITKTRVIVAGDHDWGVELVTATRPENAQGYHDPNMTVIVEEASGVSREIMEQFEGTLSNPNSLLLLIGNPNTRDCYFFDTFYVFGDRWYKMAWNAEETPASAWFDPARNERIAEQFGKESDVYRVRIKGEFPHTDPNCVLSAELYDSSAPKGAAGTKRMLDFARISVSGLDLKYQRQIGCDFARFGGDENVIVRRQGKSVVQWGFFPHTDPNEVVDIAFDWQYRSGWTDKQTQYVADAGGMGQGVMHNFYSAGKRLFEFHTQGSAFDSAKYGNRMTEAWFCLKQAMEEGVYLPHDVLMQRQLTTRQYYMDRKGRIVLETKDDYMKRQGESPDRADALVMSFYPLDLGHARIIRKTDAGGSGYRQRNRSKKPKQNSGGHTARVSRRR